MTLLANYFHYYQPIWIYLAEKSSLRLRNGDFSRRDPSQTSSAVGQSPCPRSGKTFMTGAGIAASRAEFLVIRKEHDSHHQF